MPAPGRGPGAAPSPACHNCRRRRLRCDRSLPSCRKCLGSGQKCLGYGPLLRWANAPAVRGRLVGLGERLEVSRISPPLLDPLVNHLDRRARHYVHHFATVVCRVLVSFDQEDFNPFRVIIPLATKFDFLEAIIVATGAMHTALLHGAKDQPGRPEMIDALVAKDRAIRLLRSAIDNITPDSQAMVLAATVFLINLDLIDSGKGGWQVHIEAASALMSCLQDPAHELDRSLTTSIDTIAADCLTYRVLGSAISGVALTSWAGRDLAEFFSVLRRAEAYSYHCCPPEILHILLSASSLCSDDGPARVPEALALIGRARALDVVAWVHSIRGLSAHDDLDIRVRIALAHRATACLYILLAVPEAAPSPSSVDMLVREVLEHLAAVPIDHMHLKGTIWPTFVVGAQTDDPEQRAWCMERMQAVSTMNRWMCPWGYIRTAVRMMQDLWDARDREPAKGGRRNWLLELKSMREKCLIV
ncbi:hypothetical protein MYCTH_2062045 [Thermothelomyces thermophilus ATCC 42464]|uniref:Zn(2)-C6 fungal-type domain-containing protein n=1 Tax=Thermothelomyces thermophilus (strain ATCC 42464 / BCRC 31852 / DSM 1799) TaxID=573729 RepID=G2QBZ7_THET4|nr:uncharacterized protein MYCTH_2062045 [Thermothelomyces thermophilus ATCC 42464]AEO57224.1 hypothetical protein MYCTH_2062045 [Thermothelomyces thermophilus ATCC 42464]